MHATTAKITATARYMHLWHKFLAMTNGKIMVRLSQFSVLPWFLHLLLLEICAIDAYISQSLLFSPLSHARLPFSLKHTCFGHFAIMWSSDTYLNHLWGVRSICLLDETSTARDFSLSFLILLKHCSAEWLTPPQNVHCVWTACALSLSLPKPELLSIFK